MNFFFRVAALWLFVMLTSFGVVYVIANTCNPIVNCEEIEKWP